MRDDDAPLVFADFASCVMKGDVEMVANYKSNTIAYSLMEKANNLTVRGDLESVKEGLKYLKASLVFLENHDDWLAVLRLVKEQEELITLMEIRSC